MRFLVPSFSTTLGEQAINTIPNAADKLQPRNSLLHLIPGITHPFDLSYRTSSYYYFLVLPSGVRF